MQGILIKLLQSDAQFRHGALTAEKLAQRTHAFKNSDYSDYLQRELEHPRHPKLVT